MDRTPSRRIPICAGFYVRIGHDGRPIATSSGKTREEKLEIISSWLDEHPNHADFELVSECWSSGLQEIIDETKEAHHERQAAEMLRMAKPSEKQRPSFRRLYELFVTAMDKE